MNRILVIAILSAACSNTPSNNTDGGPPQFCLGDNCVIINTSHFNPDFSGSGTINTIKTPELSVTRDIDATLDPDTVIKVANDRVYILNMDSGSLRIYDERTFHALLEIPTGDATAPNGGSFPHDFFVRGDKIYVAFGGNPSANAIGVIDTRTPAAGVVKWIAVPAAAGDMDGKPEAGNLFACDDTLWVSFADYFFDGSKVVWAPHARLVGVDFATDTMGPTIPLTGSNAGVIAQDGADCHTVLVASSGNQTSVPDGTSGIERVDLRAHTSAGFVLADTALQGRPSAIETVSPTLAFVSVFFDPQPQPNGGGLILSSAKVVAVNPQAATVGADVTGKAGFVSFVRVGPSKQLFVGAGQFAGLDDPTKLKTAVYVGPSDGSALPATGIDLGQTPAAIAFE
jgi:hypothetical protein